MTDLTVPPIAHAMQRANERYGIDLSWADLHAIAKRCKAGEGYTDSKADGVSHFHIIIFGERVLWVVYRRPKAGEPDGIVVTIMPPQVATRLNKRDAQQIERRRGRHALRRKGWIG